MLCSGSGAREICPRIFRSGILKEVYTMIWAKEETLPRDEIEAIQFAKLKGTVRYIYDRVKPYREKMDAAGVKPEDIRSLDDLKKLPFTYKADFRDHYPDGLFAVDKKEIVRYHASSGTTGKPTVVGYTRNDLEMWLNNVARLACMGGATADDVAQISFGYGTFTGALGLHGGLEKIGASVIPMSSGNTNKQIMFLQDMGVEIPEGTMVNQAVYVAVDGQLCAVCAITYAKMRSSAAGLVTLCGYSKLTPVMLCDDFMLTESFLQAKFDIKTRRMAFPDRETARQLRQVQPNPEAPVLAMTTREELVSAAYAVTGARALRTAAKLGVTIHLIGGILGMLIMLVLALLGNTELLTPTNILLYQLVWAIPGLLVTEWTRIV